ncbi:MAG: hypothetical protein V4710_12860 [Verrucomicrobiota bacterium]
MPVIGIPDPLRNHRQAVFFELSRRSRNPIGAEIAVINVVRNDIVPQLSLTLEEPVTTAQLLINLRAEAASELLREVICAAIADMNSDSLIAALQHLEYFRPGKPVPTHHMADLVSNP